MSMWTHVTGCIYVDTMQNRKDIKKYIKKILKNGCGIAANTIDYAILLFH